MSINPAFIDIVITLSNFIYISLFFTSVYLFVQLLTIEKPKKNYSAQDQKSLYLEEVRKQKRQNEGGYIYDYLSLLESYYYTKYPEKAWLYTKITIALYVLIALIVAINTMLLLGIFTFIIFNAMTSQVIKSGEEKKYTEFERELPNTLDILTRSFSKSDDIKTIFFDASKEANEPFASIFAQISRKMTSSGPITVLNELNASTKSVWIHSLYTILIRYMEDAEKNETLKNLKNLREMVAQDNQLKNSLASEKRYNVVLNYIIAALGAVGNIGIFILAPQVYATAFLQDVQGLAMLMIGYGSIVAIFIITNKLNKAQKGGDL